MTYLQVENHCPRTSVTDWIIGLLISSFFRSLCTLKINPLLDFGLGKIFSHFIGFNFALLMVSLALQKLFSFMRSHLLIVNLSACAISVLLRKLIPVPVHLRLFLTFSSTSFSVSGFKDFDSLRLEFCAW